MTREYGHRSSRRMGVGGRESSPTVPLGPPPPLPLSQLRPAHDDQTQAPVVAAVPLLRPNERDLVRTLQTASVVCLRILSEANVGDELAEYLGDHVKPFFDGASYELRKMLPGGD